MRFLPANRGEWIRLAYRASETAFVGGVIGRLALLVWFMPYQHHWQQVTISARFYRFNCLAFMALVISSLAVSGAYPGLAKRGWISIILGGIAAGFYPAVD